MDTKYKLGQIWSYRTRPGEETSTIIIAKVERGGVGPIYHIYVKDLKIKTPYYKNGCQEFLPHAPVSDETLDNSVTGLITTDVENIPDISEGYNQWKSDKGGVFDIPVKDIIQAIEDAINQ